MNRFRVLVLVLAALLMLPISAGAQDGLLTYVYLPLTVGGSPTPSMVQFRSCGGYDGIPLQYQSVPVGELTALTSPCNGGEAYPSFAIAQEGVVLGGYWIAKYDWHIAPHVSVFSGNQAQFKITFGPSGTNVQYLTVAYRQGQVVVFRGDEIFTEDTIVDGWHLTFHLDDVIPYVKLTRGETTIWTVLDHNFFWVEVQTPDVVESAQDLKPAAWGTWFYAMYNGHLPSLEVMEQEGFIIARYPFN